MSRLAQRLAWLAKAPPKFFIDPLLGNDGNSGLGRGAGQAWASTAPLVATPGLLSPGDRVGLARGRRHSPLVCSANGGAGAPIVYTPYGTGAKPLLTPAVALSSSSWTQVVNEWTMAAGGNLGPNSGGPTPIITRVDGATGAHSALKKAPCGSVTVTAANPAVISFNQPSTWASLVNGDQVYLRTNGALPAPLAADTAYYVVNKASGNFQVSLTQGGAAIDTSGGSQSGQHGFSRVLAVGEWAIAADRLRVRPSTGAPAAADVFEVPNGTVHALVCEKSHVRFEQLDMRYACHAAMLNASSATDDTVFVGCEARWLAGDGFHWDIGTATGIGLYGCIGEDVVGDGSGGGDPVSCHASGASSGIVDSCIFRRAGKFGIANFESSLPWRYSRNLFDRANLGIGASSSHGGTLTIVGNQIRNDPNVAGAYYHIKVDAIHSDTVVRILHNTLKSGTRVNASLRAMALWGGQIELKNNVVRGDYQFNLYPDSVTLVEDYNCFSTTGGHAAAHSNGGHTITSDPKFVDEANDDLRLAGDSPCLNAATVTDETGEHHMGFTGAA